MTVILKNNAFGFLQSAISNSDTSVPLQSGYGASFPTLSAGEYFYATIAPTSGASEIVKCVARAGDVLTVIRAQEGTTALAFAAGSRVELRVTAQSVIDAIADRVSQHDQASEISIADAGNFYTSGNVEGALQEAALSSTTRFTQAGSGAATRSAQSKMRDWVSVKDFGATGDGTTDDTAAIQAAVNSLTRGTVWFPAGNYRLTTNVNCKSNVNMQGENARIFCTLSWASYGKFFNISGLSNVKVSGFIFDAGGTWTATPFANPYGGGNSVGFTNNHVGIDINYPSTNITIANNTFTGLARGVLMTYSENIHIDNNTFTTMGVAGLACEGIKYATVSNNIIRGVFGNITDAGDTSTASSQYADGVYFLDCLDCAVTGNTIENIIRIGVVLEGQGSAITDNIAIVGNTFRNMNSCRGLQLNTAVWSEVNHVGYGCTVSGNVMDNTGAAAGTNPQRAIEGYRLNITGNYITGWDTGINGVEFTAIGNTIRSSTSKFGAAIGVTYQQSGMTTVIADNVIEKNGGTGLQIYQSYGDIHVRGNTFKDNGQLADTTTTPDNCSGIRIDRHYNDQRIVINGNTFISSANQSATTGQLMAILSIAGGDVSRTNRYMTDNQFIFTGTFSDSYPANLQKVPCSYAYDNTSPGGFFYYELMGNWNNWNSKAPQPAGDYPIYSGTPNFCGYSATIPATGTYKVGDFFYNSNVGATGFLGWICTVAGTPGTWYEFGPVRNNNAYTVTNGSTDRALDVTADTVAQVAAVLGTLITDLKNSKIIS